MQGAEIVGVRVAAGPQRAERRHLVAVVEGQGRDRFTRARDLRAQPLLQSAGVVEAESSIHRHQGRPVAGIRFAAARSA